MGIANTRKFSVEELRAWFTYDAATGVVSWLQSPGGNVCFGDAAGCRWVDRKTGTTYILIYFRGRHIFAHLVAWVLQAGAYPLGVVDHESGDGTDNRFLNLRDVTHTTNLRNQRRNASNKSGVMGVDFLRGKWRARIIVDQKERGLGCYDNWFDAVCARKSAERRYGFPENHGRPR